MTSNQVQIVQGERAVGAHPDMIVMTILGSCVSCCLWDPVANVGGMNHMLVTTSKTNDVACSLAGINAMELLINDILKIGGRRDRLRAKAFGGAKMVSGLSDIGAQNCAFTLDYLAKEGIQCDGHSLGGSQARHIKFWPATGKVLKKATRESMEDPVIRPLLVVPEGNGLELF